MARNSPSEHVCAAQCCMIAASALLPQPPPVWYLPGRAILRLSGSTCLHQCSLLLLLPQAHLLLQIVKTLAAAGNRKRVSAIIDKLVEEFAFSPQVSATSRKQETLYAHGEACLH